MVKKRVAPKTQFHDRTLALLGDEGVRRKRSVKTLLNYAKAKDIVLPAAFLEWAKLDDGSLLFKYSNTDSFYFDEPELVITPEGVRGLLFNRESQGNFRKIVTLDQGDDPPVLYSWLGDPPWVLDAVRFSDAVFSQIFDWQLMLEFNDPDEPDRGEIAYTGDISLKSNHCLSILRERFEETVTTQFRVDDSRYIEYRFWGNGQTRLNVTVDANDKAFICITGAYEQVFALEKQLLEEFAQDVVPRTFYNTLAAVWFLESALAQDCLIKIRLACLQQSDMNAVNRLAACHQAISLEEQARQPPYYGSFPDDASSYVLGCREWGFTINFRRNEDKAGRYQGWSIESIQ